MTPNELREWWLNTNDLILCVMADGKMALLIQGPSDEAVARKDWRFGFQVAGEEDIRWRLPYQVERLGDALVENPPAFVGPAPSSADVKIVASPSVEQLLRDHPDAEG